MIFENEISSKKNRHDLRELWERFFKNTRTNCDFEFCLESPKLHQIRDVTKIVTSQF